MCKLKSSDSYWKAKGKVWAKYNDDNELGKEDFKQKESEASENISNVLARQKHKKIKKEIEGRR